MRNKGIRGDNSHRRHLQTLKGQLNKWASDG